MRYLSSGVGPQGSLGSSDRSFFVRHALSSRRLGLFWIGAGLLLATCNAALAAPGDNLALGKPVTMSFDIGATAAACTDGVTNGDFTVTQGCQTTAVTAGANRQWIEVDLGQNFIIERVVLWNRTDIAGTSNWLLTTSRPAALAGALTDVPASAIDEINVNKLAYADGAPGPNYTSLNLYAGIHIARYVRIYNAAASQALQLAEIEVIEGPPAVRTFTNSGFELPTQPANSHSFPPESMVPGWSTTEPFTNPPSFTAGGVFELWSNDFMGVAAPEGLNFVELNSFNPAAVSQQPICMYPSETITISFRHRGRNGVDTAALTIDNVQWITVADNNAASGTHTCTVVSGPGCIQDPTGADGWTRYQTTFTNTGGGPEVISLSYAAVSSAGGASIGNFLDDVRITGLVTAVEFSTATASGPENVPTANLPLLLVSGGVTSPQTVQIAITGGTATRGVDYTTVPAAGNLVVNIPAGSYDGTLATAISLASVLQIVADPDNPPGPETIEMALVNPSGGIAITGISTCGPAVAASTYGILEPPQLSLTKQAPPAFVVGQPGTYTLQVTNTASDSSSGTITVTDIVPAGLTIVSATGSGWSCNVVSQTVTCTTSQVLVGNGGTAPPILITVTPQPTTAGTQVVNTASASGGGDPGCPAEPRCTDGVTTPVGTVATEIPTLSSWMLVLLVSLLLLLGWRQLRTGGR